MDYLNRINKFKAFSEAFDEAYGPCKTSFITAIKSGPLNESEMSLIRFGVSLGTKHEGAIQSNVRNCLRLGISKETILQAVRTANGTLGLPDFSDVYSYVIEALEVELIEK
ncbi:MULTISPECIES: hypothetical protein [Pseudomonas]|uniref:hypothetical protein n=1 Tax=Pseudomonas TaxID=286 RepID=UPI0014766E58|nr:MULTISPECIES: hypothetical protein [Pseudomonas]MCU0211239.1 hypothetical protein [Pseudomonas shahriarae]NMY21358.1 hypothetical protein [Pseudomonas sp. WS 5410]